MIRDKDATKPSFEKLRENLFFHFLPRAPLLVHHDRAVLGKTTHCLKDKGSATAYCQHITGSDEERTTF